MDMHLAQDRRRRAEDDTRERYTADAERRQPCEPLLRSGAADDRDLRTSGRRTRSGRGDAAGEQKAGACRTEARCGPRLWRHGLQPIPALYGNRSRSVRKSRTQHR